MQGLDGVGEPITGARELGALRVEWQVLFGPKPRVELRVLVDGQEVRTLRLRQTRPEMRVSLGPDAPIRYVLLRVDFQDVEGGLPTLIAAQTPDFDGPLAELRGLRAPDVPLDAVDTTGRTVFLRLGVSRLYQAVRDGQPVAGPNGVLAALLPADRFPKDTLSLTEAWKHTDAALVFLTERPDQPERFAGALAAYLYKDKWPARVAWAPPEAHLYRGVAPQMLRIRRVKGEMTTVGRQRFAVEHLGLNVDGPNPVALTATEDGLQLLNQGGIGVDLPDGRRLLAGLELFLPLTGRRVGSLQLRLAARAGDLGAEALDVALAYAVPVGEDTALLRFPLLDLDQAGCPATLFFDATLFPLRPRQSFLRFDAPDFGELQPVGASLRSIQGWPLRLRPLEGARLDLETRPGPGGADKRYFAPRGDFELFAPAVGQGSEAEATELLLGLVGVEYARVRLAGPGRGGDQVRFFSGQPALLLPPPSADDPPVADDRFTTAWITLARPGGAVTWFVQPEETPLFSAGGAPFPRFQEVPAVRIAADGVADAFPVATHATLHPDAPAALLRAAELQSLAPLRRQRILDRGASIRPADGRPPQREVVGATPQGLLAGVGAQGWADVAFAISEEPGWPRTLRMTGLTEAMQRALSACDLFTVVARDGAAGDFSENQLNIGDWLFSVALGGADALGSLLLLKFREGRVIDLIEDIGAWNEGAALTGQRAAAVRDRLRALLAPVTAAAPDDPAFGALQAVITDPTWMGVLAFDVALSDVPSDFVCLLPGFRGEGQITAHHLGFAATSVTQGPSGALELSNTDLFALIEHTDPGGPPREGDHELRMEMFRLRFAGNQVASFAAEARLRVDALFDEDAVRVDGSGARAPDNDLVLTGRLLCEQASAGMAGTAQRYVFELAEPARFLLAATDTDQPPPIAAVQVDAVSLGDGVVTGSFATTARVACAFALRGSLRFTEYEGVIDLLSFERIAFSRLRVRLDFTATGTATRDERYAFDASGLSLDAEDATARPMSAYATMPLRLDGFRAAPPPAPGQARSFFTLAAERMAPAPPEPIGEIGPVILEDLSAGGTAGDDFLVQAETRLAYGLDLTLDLGSLGSLVPGGATLSLRRLLGWRPTRLGGEQYLVGTRVGEDDTVDLQDPLFRLSGGGLVSGGLGFRNFLFLNTDDAGVVSGVQGIAFRFGFLRVVSSSVSPLDNGLTVILFVPVGPEMTERPPVGWFIGFELPGDFASPFLPPMATRPRSTADTANPPRPDFLRATRPRSTADTANPPTPDPATRPRSTADTANPPRPETDPFEDLSDFGRRAFRNFRPLYIGFGQRVQNPPFIPTPTPVAPNSRLPGGPRNLLDGNPIGTTLGAIRTRLRPESSPLQLASSYDPEADWLVALEFLLVNRFNLQIVSVDRPGIHGARISVPNPDTTGRPMADPDVAFFKRFGGASLQILYRRVDDEGLGVFSGRLTLPNFLRVIEAGPLTLMLPRFGLDIYTNGDFLIDFGFPSRGDFSQSGGATFGTRDIRTASNRQRSGWEGRFGFFAGRLSGASAPFVRTPYQGTFDPINAFGVGVSLTRRWSFSSGPVSVSLSIGGEAIVEGLVARFVRSEGEVRDDDSNTYHLVAGSFTLIAMASFEVNLPLIRASGELIGRLGVAFTTERYFDSAVTAFLQVDISLSVTITIPLIFFTITISFSFAFGVQLDIGFTIPGETPRPLFLEPPTAAARVTGDHSSALPDGGPLDAPIRWESVAVFDAPSPLRLVLAPQMALAEDGAPQLVLTTLLPLGEADAEGRDDLDRLVEGLLRWLLVRHVIDGAIPEDAESPLAFAAGRVDLDPLLRTVDLERLDARLSLTPNLSRLPGGGSLDYAALRAFLGRNFDVRVEAPPRTAAPMSMSCMPFPVLPELALATEGRAGGEYTVDFATHARRSRDYEDALGAFFDEQAPAPSAARPPAAGEARVPDIAPPGEGDPSMAQILFEDAMGLLVRAIVDRAHRTVRDEGESFTLPDGSTTEGLHLSELLPKLRTPAQREDIGGVVARSLMQGIRLPASFVEGARYIEQPPERLSPLYALTGQQFPMNMPTDRALRLAVTAPGDSPWFTLTPFDDVDETDVTEDVPAIRLTVWDPAMAAASPSTADPAASVMEMAPADPMPAAEVTVLDALAPLPMTFMFEERTAWTPGEGAPRTWLPIPPALLAAVVDPPGGAPARLTLGQPAAPMGMATAQMFAPQADLTPRFGLRLLLRVRAARDALRLASLDTLRVAPLGEAERERVRALLGAVAEARLTVDRLDLLFDAVGGQRSDALGEGTFLSRRDVVGVDEGAAMVAPLVAPVEALRLLLEQAAVSSEAVLSYRTTEGAGLPEGFAAEADEDVTLTLLVELGTPEGRAPTCADTLILDRPMAEVPQMLLARVEGLDAAMPQIPAGMVALELRRPRPEGELARRFDLVAARIAGGEGFTPTPFGMPTSPQDQPDAPDVWLTRHALPVAPFAADAVVEGGSVSPYAGVGRAVDIELEVRDHFGNRLPGGAGRRTVTAPVRYADGLLHLDAWPGVQQGFRVEARDDGAALLLELTFDGAALLGDMVESARTTLRRALDQLDGPAVTVTLHSSLRAGRPEEQAGWRDALRGFLRDALGQLDQDTPGSARASLALPVSATEQADIVDTPVELRFGLTVARADHVDPAAAALLPDVAAVTTAIPLLMVGMDGDTADALSALDVAFRAAFPGLVLATGQGPSGPGALQVVRLDIARVEETLPADGLGVRPLQEEARFFAIPPLSNRLLSRAAARLMRLDADGDLEEQGAMAALGQDLDGLGRRFAAAVDLMLEPARAAAAGRLAPGALSALLSAKASLARSISARVRPVFEDGDADVGDGARDAFARRLRRGLSAAFTVETAVQVDLAAQNPGAQANLYGRVLGASPGAAGSLSIDPALLTLGAGDRAALTFLVDADQAEAQRFAALDLSWMPTHLETDIQDASAAGPRRSSWLTLVAGEPPIELGRAVVPIPLRGAPTPPVVLSQQATAQQADAGQPLDLETATSWTLRFTYGHEAVAQDEVMAAIDFNMLSDAEAEATTDMDLFDGLVSFVTAWPELEAVLTDLVAAEADADRRAEALRATRAVAGYATLIAEQWARWDSGAVAAANRSMDAETVGMLQAVYAVRERPIAGEDAVEVTVTPTSEAARGLGLRMRMPGDEADRQPISEDEAAGSATFRLDAVPSGAAAVRTLVLRDLDVLAREDAWSGLRLVRNASLSPDEGRRTDMAFIFRTPLTRFAEMVTPFVDRADPLDIAALSDPTRQPLARHLSTLFGRLLDEVTFMTEVPRLVQVTVRYAYEVRENHGEREDAPLLARLPVLLAGPAAFDLTADGAPDGDSFVARLAGALTAWLADTQPSRRGGRFLFDLRMFARITETELPLLRLSGLQLALEDLDDATGG
ncbi:MAG: hypothetical protein H6739_09435 [Alphaproteobacteria bacterium]|nr:hypothetical protein [Alphaproteobacteria bacterium]